MKRHLPSSVPRLPILFWIALICPAMAIGQDTPASQFEKIATLRTEAKFDEAIEILSRIIAGTLQPDEVLTRAYGELVFTHLSREDTTAAEETARRALSRFPHLKVDPLYIPSTVGDLLDELRAQMFGSFILTTRPDSCRVELDGALAGLSPLTFQYLAVGDHTLRLTKPGYNDFSAGVTIEPGSKTGMHYALERYIDPSLRPGARTGTALSAGLSTPRGGAADFAETGVMVSGAGWLAIPRTGFLLLQVAVQGLFFGGKDGPRVDVGPYQYQVTYGINVLKIGLTVEACKKSGAFEPYIRAGGGLNFVFIRSELVNEDGDDVQGASKNDGHVSGTISGGSRFYVTSSTAVDLSLQYDWSREVNVPSLVPDVPSSSFDLRSLSLVVAIHFGRT